MFTNNHSMAANNGNHYGTTAPFFSQGGSGSTNNGAVGGGSGNAGRGVWPQEQIRAVEQTWGSLLDDFNTTPSNSTPSNGFGQQTQQQSNGGNQMSQAQDSAIRSTWSVDSFMNNASYEPAGFQHQHQHSTHQWSGA